MTYAMTSAVVTLKNFRVKLSKSDVIEGHWFLMIRNLSKFPRIAHATVSAQGRTELGSITEKAWNILKCLE